MAKSLAAFLALVLACAVLLALTYAITRPRIDHNRAKRFTESVHLLLGESEALPAIRWENDVWHLCNGRALVRGSTRGYGGPLRWLTAVSVAGTEPVLLGLSITQHQETPGIADFIGRPDDPWMRELIGRGPDGLDDVAAVTGATITSRAVVAAIRSALQHPGLDAEPACQP
jgi:Na+-translocating ferredoxin:NAD+ oxidoreductase RnfG subunit